MQFSIKNWFVLAPLACGLFLPTRLAAWQPAAEDPDTNATRAVTSRAGKRGAGVEMQALVRIGGDAELKAGDSAEAVVAIGGTARVHGKVRGTAVAVGGDVEVDGEVGNAVVSVLGNIRVKRGAELRGEVVAVGGQVEVEEGANIHGKIQEVPFPLHGLQLEWLKNWFVHCVLKLRPLAPQVGWVWILSGLFFLFYVLLTVVFPRPVGACVEELTSRPATTFLLGFLTMLLVPLVTIILLATAIGVFVLPFLAAALFFGGLVGKAALLQAFGLRIGRQLNVGALQHPLVALFVGAVLINAFYLVPVLGLVIFGVISLWALGAAVAAAFGGLRREMPEKPVSPAPAAPLTTFVPAPSEAAPGIAPQDVPQSQVQAAAPTPAPATVPEVLAYGRAGFWRRMAASLLDLILVGTIAGFTRVPFLGLMVILAYFAGMWTWKGTTFGGIVLGLKVARLDGQPVTLMIALVRALAGAFSIMVFFLGILWIAWDREKQGWHDRIAGTVVLRLPRGMPLLL